MTFTKSVRKILLLKDVPKLGFEGEFVFVKPGHAWNDLVPKKKALMATDHRVEEAVKNIDVSKNQV
jgi:ribosomal protein L9